MFRLGIAAWMLDDIATAVLDEAMRDILLVRSQLEKHEGGLTAAIAHYSAGAETPELLFVQSRDGIAVVKEQLEQLAGTVSPGTQVVVLGTIDSIEFYRQVIELGVGQYLLEPLTKDRFITAITDVFGAESAVTRGRVIAVIGAKGGVGASTVAHNIAWALATKYEKPVSLLDLDLHWGTVGIDFNHEQRSGLRDAAIQLATTGALEEAFVERLFTKETDHLWLLASNPSMADSEALLTPEVMEGVIDTVARMSSFVVLDLPHMWNTAIGNTLVMADEAVVVTEPSLSGLRNTQLLFETLNPAKPQGTFLRYVVNGTGLDGATEVGDKDFTEAVGSAPLLSLPWTPAVFRGAGAQGRMLGQTKGQAKLAASFTGLAERLSGRDKVKNAYGRRKDDRRAPRGKKPAEGPKTSLLARLLGRKPKTKE